MTHSQPPRRLHMRFGERLSLCSKIPWMNSVDFPFQPELRGFQSLLFLLQNHDLALYNL